MTQQQMVIEATTVFYALENAIKKYGEEKVNKVIEIVNIVEDVDIAINAFKTKNKHDEVAIIKMIYFS